MKKLLLILLLCFPMVSLAQSSDYYIYNIVSIEGRITKEGLKVKVDDGKIVEKLKDANGKDMKFNTPAAVLMFFISQGWTLYVSGATSQGGSYSFNGTGGGHNTTTSYWILRKPCTQEEFDKAVKDGIRNYH